MHKCLVHVEQEEPLAWLELNSDFLCIVVRIIRECIILQVSLLQVSHIDEVLHVLQNQVLIICSSLLSLNCLERVDTLNRIYRQLVTAVPIARSVITAALLCRVLSILVLFVFRVVTLTRKVAVNNTCCDAATVPSQMLMLLASSVKLVCLGGHDSLTFCAGLCEEDAALYVVDLGLLRLHRGQAVKPAIRPLLHVIGGKAHQLLVRWIVSQLLCPVSDHDVLD